MAEKQSTSQFEKEKTSADNNYTVLARRYRPKQFAELVGQEHIAQALANALKANRVAHAYLFTGNRGVGKTSTARILAKALNCQNGPTPTPCDQCEICRSIADGEDMDVLEIDGASNRGIDEIREIRQNVQFRPSRSRFKIYIVDEVHMLTRDAFNALLKTLEEPPQHVKFVFATTEVHKVPVTILSRCQRFDFWGISVARIVSHLKEILRQEGIDVESEALEILARRAGGSMRDAESLLDQLLAFSDSKITSKQVHQLLGTAHDDRVLALAEDVIKGELTGALSLLEKAADEGIDLGELVDQIISFWRDLLVANCSAGKLNLFSVTSNNRDQLVSLAKKLDLDSILAGLDILVSTKSRLSRSTSHSRTLLEMALVRLARISDLISIASLAEQLQNPSNTPLRQTNPRPAKTLTDEKKKLTDPTETPRVVETATSSHLDLNSDNLNSIWHHILANYPSKMFALALEKGGTPAIIGPNTLVIQLSAEYNLLREQCQDPTRVNLIRESLRGLCGSKCEIRIETTTDDVKSKVEGGDKPPSPRLRTLPETQTIPPLMKAAMDILGAQESRRDAGFANAE